MNTRDHVRCPSCEGCLTCGIHTAGVTCDGTSSSRPPLNAVTVTPSRPLVRGFAGEYGFLSNFHPSRIRLDGIEYPTAEHAFQAHKSLDLGEREHISNCGTAGDAKSAGRRLKLRADWERVKKQVMLRILIAKFSADRNLAYRLAATEDAVLVEANWWHDNYWGDCNCKRPSCAEPGLNYLGEILMGIRPVFRED